MPSGKDRNNKQLRSRNIMIKARKKIKQDKSDGVIGEGSQEERGDMSARNQPWEELGGSVPGRGSNTHSSFIHSPHRYFLSTCPVCAGTQTTLNGE